MATVNDGIILPAYVELGVIQDTSETISTTLRDNAFVVLNQGISRSSAERVLAYNVVHGSFNLSAGVTAYTLGTAGTLATAARPVAVTSWKSVSGGFSNGGDPMSFDAFREKQQNLIGANSVLVQVLAADQGFPSINVEVFPPPSISPGTLFIDYWTPLVQFSATSDTLTLPDGYERFFVLMLANDLETRFPLESGVRAKLRQNYLETKQALVQRVAAILGATAVPVQAPQGA